MSDLAIARRYAQALSEQSKSDNVVSTTDDDVALIRESLAGSPELLRFFASPVVSRPKKLDVVKALFSERIGKGALDLLQLLIRKHREAHLVKVLAAYQSLRDDEQGVQSVSVRSARPISDGDRASISAALEKRIGKRARLSVAVDDSLIGGIVVQVGDTVYDGSVSNRLATLRERLLDSAILN